MLCSHEIRRYAISNHTQHTYTFQKGSNGNACNAETTKYYWLWGTVKNATKMDLYNLNDDLSSTIWRFKICHKIELVRIATLCSGPSLTPRALPQIKNNLRRCPSPRMTDFCGAIAICFKLRGNLGGGFIPQQDMLSCLEGLED